MHPDELHYHDFINREVSFLQTVKENEEGHSQRQLEQARLAKDIYTKVGHSLQQDFKAMVAGGMILNCPITVADVIRAENIWSKNFRVERQDREVVTRKGQFNSTQRLHSYTTCHGGFCIAFTLIEKRSMPNNMGRENVPSI
jgi:hypothetical protein